MRVGCNVSWDTLEELLILKPDIPVLQFYTHNTKPFLRILDDEQMSKISKMGKTTYIHSTFNTVFDMYSGRKIFAEQYKLCGAYGVKGIVLHIPRRPVDELVEGFKCFDDSSLYDKKVILFLEHVPSDYGSSPDLLMQLYNGLKNKYPGFTFGVCLDTCHIYSSGVDLGEVALMQKWIKAMKDVPVLIHLNDSYGELGSYVDRHAPLGERIWKESNSALKVLLGEKWDAIIEIKSVEDMIKSLNFIEKIDF